MRISFAVLASTLALAAFSGPALGQAANPLQTRGTVTAPATETKPATRPRAAEDKTDEKKTADKPKRARSPAQLANDDRMRKCGGEWRANKEKLTGQGQTWRSFSTECRRRLKAAGA